MDTLQKRDTLRALRDQVDRLLASPESKDDLASVAEIRRLGELLWPSGTPPATRPISCPGTCDCPMPALMETLLLTGHISSELASEYADNTAWRRLVAEVTALAQFAQALADGDVSHEIDIKGPLAESLNSLQAKLRHLIMQARNSAAAASKAKSQFLANMSHEIRTPMNAILGFTEILGDRIKDPAQREYIESISASGKKLLALINDILDLSKADAGHLELRYSAVNLRSLGEDLRKSFARECQQKGLSLAVQIDPALPDGLQLDENRVRQILLNLMGNAVKFTHQGGIILAISSRPVHAIPDMVELTLKVRDTGIGVLKDQQDAIFEAFQQQPEQRNRQYGGAGLGLTISRRLVDAMGGRILVESEPGQGSEFTVTLSQVKTIQAPTTAGQNVERAPVLPPSVVLVVDDVSFNRMLLKAYLSMPGFTILEAANGAEALEMIRQQTPDVILTDMKMPVMDGYELARRLKADPAFRKIPLIAVTASAIQNRDLKAEEAGCDGCVNKPVTRTQLMQVLANFLKTTQAQPAPSDRELAPAELPGAPDWPPDNPARWPELLEKLRTECEPEGEQLRRRIYINRVKTLAEKVGAMGLEYQAAALCRWSEDLRRQAENFDMKKLPATLAELSSLVEVVAGRVKERKQ